MGVITVEVPQSVEETYTIKSEAKAARIIETVREAGKRKKRGLSALVGIWSDRTESAEEIARELRRKSNMIRDNG